MDQRDGRTGGRAQLQGRLLPGGCCQGGHIGAHLRRAVNGGNHILQGDDVLRRAYGLQGGHGLHAAGVALQHVHFLLNGGIAQGNPQKEAVHLRLGQGVGAHEFAWILRRQHDEGLGQGMGHAVHGDLLFLHHLQQRRLGFGAGAVDLIRQNHLAHDGPFLIFHFTRLEVYQGEAGHVGGHQVGGELDASEGTVQRPGQGAGQGGLAHAGHILNQHMPPAQQRDEGILDGLLLSDDDLCDVILQGSDDPPGLLHMHPPPLLMTKTFQHSITNHSYFFKHLLHLCLPSACCMR